MGKLKRSKSNTELRWGYTTGACAAAAARAAVRALIAKELFTDIEIKLPNRDLVTFPLARLETGKSEGFEEVIAGVIKDAGDDPDCTHGLEIQCTARWDGETGIHLKGGEGVATVTLPGLELPVGEPAINPVPKANILEMAELEWAKAPDKLRDEKGLELTISVPGGEEAAKQTISERLGLIGGISILGTRGTVKPYSTSAYAASVRQSVQIAQANGLDHLVLTTGSRSEKAAMAQFPELGEMAFIQAGDFIGVGLRAAKRYGINRVTLVTMIGKLGKLTSGRMMTHVSGHAIDFKHLSELASESNIPKELCQQITEANTGRHVLDLVREHNPTDYFNRLCEEAQKHASEYVTDAVAVDVLFIDFDGSPLGRFSGEVQAHEQRELEELSGGITMDSMQQMTRQGRVIENDSFSIIDNEIEQFHGGHNFDEMQWPVVRRAIHTTGDFEFAKLFKFSPGAVQAGISALKAGSPIISDVTMITSGISAQRLSVNNNQAYCFISDKGVIAAAKESGDTRAIWAMRKARDLGLLDGAIIGVGNAPTALYEILRMVEADEIKPALVIGIPVGFVKAEESKQALLEQKKVPYILSTGRKGGSPIVVSTIHALLYQTVENDG
ncbi:cobalt-precorrin-5B (C(1))-methyltransferase [Vibrio hannami]|uniref:cobalt-precorrin-5B (C(1))-methyltransferase n=1 Tax=Vibrio hannami TaxID=2717094 RepID=UPI0024109BAF|nr:cobalt-precorrin-5B (C(1))-methyltransferase [Vibrio hannami]MDG3085151.1 cobalt-precorrin-5B (C(1))-methyltransferase [Vibrio hannami]